MGMFLLSCLLILLVAVPTGGSRYITHCGKRGSSHSWLESRTKRHRPNEWQPARVIVRGKRQQERHQRVKPGVPLRPTASGPPSLLRQISTAKRKRENDAHRLSGCRKMTRHDRMVITQTRDHMKPSVDSSGSSPYEANSSDTS